MKSKALAGMACAALALSTSSCRVHVDKDANGQEKTVQVDTPFGGVHVNTDQTAAGDLGLPVYPGSDIVKDKDGNKSADVHMGFGEWQLRVRAVSYSTTDPKDKVVAFYKKALARYGDVITCQGNAPVGTPTVTSEGLSCSDDGRQTHFQFNGKANGIDMSSELQLKAGSKRHQHIVGFEAQPDNKTKFALVSLDLPAVVDGSSDKSD
ncbi:MAG TPA: hypothetical protein VK716_14535 [Terracidiphilus sp.]|jgi:hypothetical protein|nr:hypothetical protein [Terracidiphilus sp.]